jgi:acetyl esterase/lipase
MKTCFVIAAVMASLLFSACNNDDPAIEPVPTIEKNVSVANNVAYIENDTTSRHKLDVYYKKGASNMPVILFIPGGAWRQGDKEKYVTLAKTLDSLYNYTVVVANYRLSNPDDGGAVHPAHVQDVAAAFKWVMQNISAYGGSSSKVYLFGQSAGGHLVSLLATDAQYITQAGYTLADIKGVISMSGAYSLDKLVEFPSNPFSLSAEEVLMYKAIVMNAFGSYDSSITFPASPINHVSNAIPPFLIIYSEGDMPGFDQDADAFYAKMKQIGLTNATVKKIYQSDYTVQTWESATQLAAEEPIMADYIGHYAEVVAINEHDYQKAPTTWIVDFIAKNP